MILLITFIVNADTTPTVNVKRNQSECFVEVFNN